MKPSKFSGKVVVWGGLALGSLGCTGASRGCTDIGCLDGVTAVFSPPLAIPDEVTIVLTGDVELSCTQSSTTNLGPCADQGVSFSRNVYGELTTLTLYRLHPNSLTVEILAGNDRLLESTTTTIRYETVQPNGPDCEPTCRQADIEIGGQ